MADDPRSARQKILTAAHERFYRDGFRAVGIDTIIAESGVAKMTLYRHFASKDDLITAYVTRADGLYKEWFDAAAGDEGRPARARILALFDAQTEQIQPARCRGCPFLMALAEIPDAAHPAHQAAEKDLRQNQRGNGFSLQRFESEIRRDIDQQGK